MLSKPDAAMDGDDSCGEVEYLHLREASGLEHGLQLLLIRMHADRLGEIAIRLSGARDAFAEPWQHLERIEVIRTLERRPDFGELEHHRSAAGFEHPRHLGKRAIL